MQGNVNIFATSHFIPDIEAQFEGFIWKEIRVKDDDMLRYVNGRIPQFLQSRITKYPDLQNLIRQAVIKATDGT